MAVYSSPGPIRRRFGTDIVPRDPEKFVIGRTESGQDSGVLDSGVCYTALNTAQGGLLESP